MEVKQIENDDFSFLEWLMVNHHGYVLNLRKKGVKRQVALHTAWCKKVTQRKKTDRVSPFTGQKYKKVVAHELSQLLNWAASEKIEQSDISICSSCNPFQPNNDYIQHGHELLDNHFECEMLAAHRMSNEEHELELSRLNTEAKTRVFTARQIERNPSVVREVLKSAKGVCNNCKKLGPFKRRTDGSPFLEVHHIKPLSEKGDDVVSNCEALCPNCHRKEHFGAKE